MKEHGLEVEPDEEEFGYGKLLIDYKPPNKSTSKISNKGIFNITKDFDFCVFAIIWHFSRLVLSTYM